KNVGDLPGNVVHGTEFQLVVNLPTQRKIVRHPTIGREKSSVCKDDPALMQKFLTKQSFVDVLPVKPDRQIHIRHFTFLPHGTTPPFVSVLHSPEGKQSCPPSSA